MDFKSGESIGLQLQSKNDKATPEELERMVQEISDVVQKYGYKIGSKGKWRAFEKAAARQWITKLFDQLIDKAE